MGYYSMNRFEIVRGYTPREIVARVYCDERQKWLEEKFPFDALDRAVAWCVQCMNSLSM